MGTCRGAWVVVLSAPSAWPWVHAQYGGSPLGAARLTQVSSPFGSIGSAQAPDRPWDGPSTVQAPAAWQGNGQGAGGNLQQPAAFGHAQGPLVIGGMEFSREDDIENMEKLSNVFGQVFYASVFEPNQVAAQQAWQELSGDIWSLVEYATQVPALALSVAMCLYNYFWWEGPHSADLNIEAGIRAAELMYVAVQHAHCNDPSLPPMDFFIQQCHLRWRYLVMLAGEVGRHMVLHRRDVGLAAQMLRRLQGFFQELRKIPHAGLLHGISPHEVNFNVDYYPAAVMRHGPVWKDPVRDLPLAGFLESHYPTIRGELDAILAAGDTFRQLDEQTRNAETQFGPRGDDWLTAYMFRNAEAMANVCAYAPKTCALLASRAEVAGCHMGGSGAGFLRMAPGGRLKPHFGNAPRLSVHLGLIVPPGEIRMNVGYESARWEEGRVLVFDDTFIHQVVHNGDAPRYVLNVWMCHPCDADNGKHPGEAVPAYCGGAVGAMHQLGLQPLPPKAA